GGRGHSRRRAGCGLGDSRRFRPPRVSGVGAMPMRLISCAFVIGAALSCTPNKESLVVLNITRAADVPPIASLQLQVGPVLKTLATAVPRQGDTEPPLQLGIYIPASAKTQVIAD